MLTKEQDKIYQRALGSVRMEGQEPTDFAKDVMRRRLEGEITYEQGLELILDNAKRQLSDCSEEE